MSFRSSSESLRWINDLDRIESSTVILIYIQIGCSIVGSIGAMLNGVLLLNLVLSLFLLDFMDSRRLRFKKPYFIFLGFSILMDIVWLALFTQYIWEIPLWSEKYEYKIVLTLKLILVMQVVSFVVRSLFCGLLIQICRLAVPSPVITAEECRQYQDPENVCFYPRYVLDDNESEDESSQEKSFGGLVMRSMPFLDSRNVAGKEAVRMTASI